jgi:aerobic carbon-monoxide dehydrogenase medium subunit
MYPSRFRYEAPRSVGEAISLLSQGGDEAKVLAGGQSLVPLMKLRFASPELIVDINNIPGLDYHREDADGTIRIGALCRHADLERSALLRSKQPVMASAAPLIADPIVRNRGTLVGSLCHADPQGDWASVVTALGGHVVARGPGGRRTIQMADFVTGPFQNSLAPDELAVEAVIPAPRGTLSGGYLKLERRVGDFATVGVAVAVETSDGTVTTAGIALTGVGGSTISATDAAQALVGQPLTAETITRAADLAAAAARPRTDHRGSAEYKRHLVRTFVVRILSRGDGEAANAAGDDTGPKDGESGNASGGNASGGNANGGGANGEGDAERAA